MTCTILHQKLQQRPQLLNLLKNAPPTLILFDKDEEEMLSPTNPPHPDSIPWTDTTPQLKTIPQNAPAVPEETTLHHSSHVAEKLWLLVHHSLNKQSKNMLMLQLDSKQLEQNGRGHYTIIKRILLIQWKFPSFSEHSWVCQSEIEMSDGADSCSPYAGKVDSQSYTSLLCWVDATTYPSFA